MVQSFKFNKDRYEETRKIYLGILEKLGIENPEQFLEERMAEIPEDKRDGVMFSAIIAEMFYDDEHKYLAWQTPKEIKGRTEEEKQIAEVADGKRRQKASEVLQTILEDESISPYTVGYFAEMAGDYIPFDTVLTAGETVGEGKSLQMGCGEGKTGVLALAVYAKSRDPKKQIFLTSSTSILAEEALDKLEYYDRLGIADRVCLITKKGITIAKIDEETGRAVIDKNGKVERETISFEGKTEEEIRKLLEEAYSKYQIITSDNATLMQHAMQGYLPKPEKGKTRELLADEADFVLLDSYRPLQQTKKMTEDEKKQSIEQRKVAYEILHSLNQDGLYIVDDTNQYVDFTDKGREQVIAKINEVFGNEPNIDKNKIFDYVYDALVVETVYKENRDYQILDEGRMIVSEDRASGVEIDLPQGVKQALEIKLQNDGRYVGEISEEERAIDTINVQTFFNEYFNGRKHFVSGTLGVESEEIAEEIAVNFGVSKEEEDIYEIPPKGKGQRIDQGRKMFKGQDEKRKAIIDNALKEIEAGRPVLIGTISEEEIKALRAELESRGLGDKMPTVLEYTAASEKIFQEDKENLTDEEFEKKYGVTKLEEIEITEKELKLDDEKFKEKFGIEKSQAKIGDKIKVDRYKKYSDLIKNEAGKKNTITFGTSIIGRGTTIKTKDEIDGKGGIHVIIDGLHETSSRNQEQYKARTARGTNAGSTIEFFSLEDIPEEYREEFEDRIDDPDGVYTELYKKIDARTRNIRQYVVELVEQTRKQIEIVVNDEILTDEQKAEIKSLVVARAFSIKNRACGVSDRFEGKVEEYKREIEIYRKMYMARYLDKDFPKDEAQWLKDNNFADIARRHIPFSRGREEQIFTLAGIRSQVKGARKGKYTEMTSQTRDVATMEQSIENPKRSGEEK